MDADATADDVIRATRAVTEASLRATSAARSAEEHESIVAAANFARQAIAELLTTTMAAAASGAESAEMRARVLHAGRDVAVEVRELLARLVYLLGRPGNSDAERAILFASESVSQVSVRASAASAAANRRRALNGSRSHADGGAPVSCKALRLYTGRLFIAAARRLLSNATRLLVGARISDKRGRARALTIISLERARAAFSGQVGHLYELAAALRTF